MLASLQQAVGAALGEQGHSNDALVADRDALAALSASGATDSDTVGRQIQLREDVALILVQHGNLADALTADQAAVSVARQSHSAKPDDAQFKIAYAEALGEESWLLIPNKRPRYALDLRAGGNPISIRTAALCPGKDKADRSLLLSAATKTRRRFTLPTKTRKIARRLELRRCSSRRFRRTAQAGSRFSGHEAHRGLTGRNHTLSNPVRCRAPSSNKGSGIYGLACSRLSARPTPSPSRGTGGPPARPAARSVVPPGGVRLAM